MHSAPAASDMSFASDCPVIPAGQLEDARRIIEEKFLAAGTLLSHTVKGVGSVISSLDNLSQRLNADLVQTTTDELKSAADSLCLLPEAHTSRTVHLQNLGDCSKDLVAEIEAMLTALAYMRAITVNVRIVSGMQDNYGDEFAVFADEIAECITTCSNEVTGLATDCKNLRSKLADAVIQNQELGQTIALHFPALPDDIIQRATTISGHYGTVAETTKRVGDLARDIRSNVSRTLLALQIGDITRQRIEHIQATITHAEDFRSENETNDADYIRSLIYELAKDHLEATSADFKREVREINQAMTTLATDARQLLELHNMAFHEKGDEQGGVLHHLAEKIRQVQALTDTIVHADVETENTGRQTSDAVKALSCRIQNIQMLKRDVHYMALNTTLRSLQIGLAGLPLSVVASTLREHAEKLDIAAGKCLGTLNTIQSAAEKLSGENTNRVDNTNTIKRLDSAATRVIEAGEATEKNITDVAQKGDDVLKNLEASSHSLELKEIIGGLISQANSEINQITENKIPDQNYDTPLLQQIMDTLYKKYTMAQERDIHIAFSARHSLKKSEANNSAEGFNTELF